MNNLLQSIDSNSSYSGWNTGLLESEKEHEFFRQYLGFPKNDLLISGKQCCVENGKLIEKLPIMITTIEKGVYATIVHFKRDTKEMIYDKLLFEL